MSGAKDGGADADEGRALLNGDFEVAAHAHGEVLKLGGFGSLAIDFIAQFTQLFEEWAAVFREGGEGWDDHQPDELEVFAGVDKGDEFVGVFGFDTAL